MLFSYFLVILWLASIVDVRVFWQGGSITNILNCNDCHVFESNKYLLLLRLLLPQARICLRNYCYNIPNKIMFNWPNYHLNNFGFGPD